MNDQTGESRNDGSDIVVITPTLGRSVHLEHCVTSVATLARSTPLRHILVCPDSASNDLSRRFPEVEIVGERPGGGLYGAIEEGLAFAGDWNWFSYINDDDMLLSGFLETVRCHQGTDTQAIVYGQVDLVDEHGSRIAPFPVCRNPRRFHALWWMGITPFTQQGTMVGRAAWERLGGFDEEFRLNADFALWAKAILNQSTFIFQPEKVAAFRMRRGQLSSDLERVGEEKRRILEKYFSRTPPVRERLAAWLEFRATNAAGYIERVLRRGWRRSESLLGEKL